MSFYGRHNEEKPGALYKVIHRHCDGIDMESQQQAIVVAAYMVEDEGHPCSIPTLARLAVLLIAYLLLESVAVAFIIDKVKRTHD